MHKGKKHKAKPPLIITNPCKIPVSNRDPTLLETYPQEEPVQGRTPQELQVDQNPVLMAIYKSDLAQIDIWRMKISYSRTDMLRNIVEHARRTGGLDSIA